MDVVGSSMGTLLCLVLGALVSFLITVCTLSLSPPLLLLCSSLLAVLEASLDAGILEDAMSGFSAYLDPWIVLVPFFDDIDWSI